MSNSKLKFYPWRSPRSSSFYFCIVSCSILVKWGILSLGNPWTNYSKSLIISLIVITIGFLTSSSHSFLRSKTSGYWYFTWTSYWKAFDSWEGSNRISCEKHSLIWSSFDSIGATWPNGNKYFYFHWSIPVFNSFHFLATDFSRRSFFSFYLLSLWIMSK